MKNTIEHLDKIAEHSLIEKQSQEEYLDYLRELLDELKMRVLYNNPC
jgi:hypothetical protein